MLAAVLPTLHIRYRRACLLRNLAGQIRWRNKHGVELNTAQS
jgi:hypothetical protein